MKTFLLLLFSLTLCMLLGCELSQHYRYHAPDLKLQKKDFNNLLKQKSNQKSTPKFIPNLQKISQQQPTPQMLKLVTVSIQEKTPLKNVFIELFRHTNIGLALNPNISGSSGITYTAYQKQFLQILQDICELTNMRFKIQENTIKIESDNPFLKTYNVQFLSQTRKSEHHTSVSTDVFTALNNTRYRADNGSDSLLAASTQTDFWEELKYNLNMMLSPGESSTNIKNSPYFSIHKQGGIVIVFANSKQHKSVYEFLDNLKKNTSVQVLIEAKIIEVALADEFRSGINWNLLGRDLTFTAPLGSLVTPGLFDSSVKPTRDVSTFAIEHKDFSSVLNLIKRFGTVRTLSNPRLTVMNNQPAMLKVATNEVFFHLEFERLLQGDGKPDIETISSDVLTVPIGLVLVVQPSVNIQTGDIIMTLRPTISRVDKEVEDPAVSIRSQQKVKSTVPVVQVRELDSVLRMKSGQIIIMGGLMEDRSINNSSSIPGLDSIPFINLLVQSKSDKRKTTELIIFLSAEIIDTNWDSIADEDVYQTFIQDPRPLHF